MEEKLEVLGQCIDSLDNYANALKLNIKDAIHVEALREGLPDLVDKFKEAFINLTGDNPWE